MIWFDKGDLASFRRTALSFFFFNLWNYVARKEGQITRLFFYFEDTPAWPLSKSLIGLFSVILSRLLLVCRIDLSGSEFAPLHKSSKSDYLNGKYLTLAPLWQEVVPYSKDVYTKLQSARMIHSGEVSHRWDKRASASLSFFVLMLFFFFFSQYALSPTASCVFQKIYTLFNLMLLFFSQTVFPGATRSEWWRCYARCISVLWSSELHLCWNNASKAQTYYKPNRNFQVIT